MTALEFEQKALSNGLRIGWKLDFKWVESMDDRKCCLLISNAAVNFAAENGIETEPVPNDFHLCYFQI